MPTDIGIIIPLREEFQEFYEVLVKERRFNVEPVPDGVTGRSYFRFDYSSEKLAEPYHCTAVYVGGAGPKKAGLVTQRLINDEQPSSLIMLGIAASLDESVKLGDVVIPDEVDDYLDNAKAVAGKIKGTFDFQLSGDHYAPSSFYARIGDNYKFTNPATYDQWQKECFDELLKDFSEEERGKLITDGLISNYPQIPPLPCRIASGIIVGATRSFKAWVKKGDRKYCALEMETAGYLAAIMEEADPKRSLILRAISDNGDARKRRLDKTKGGVFRRYAIRNAIALLWLLLDTGTFPRSDEKKVVLPFNLAPRSVRRKLVGRDTLRNKLKMLLFDNMNTILSLWGLPGVGKTAMLLSLAHDPEVTANFKDGVLWTSLGPKPDLYTSLIKWANVLQIPPVDIAAITGSDDKSLVILRLGKFIREQIASRRMLVILDDAWGLADANALVGGNNCMHMLSTRQPKLAAQFANYSATGEVVQVGELDEDDGVKLLEELAPIAVKADPTVANELIRAVGGLPLAITLMGHYLRDESQPSRRLSTAIMRLRQAEERLKLSQYRSPLELPSNLPDDVPLSLIATIQISDMALSIPARRLLRTLSVFPPKPNTFSDEVALATATQRAKKPLDALRDSGLLEITAENRYTMHQTIWDYARLEKPNLVAERRLINFYIGYLKPARSVDEIEQDITNIFAALDTAQVRHNWNPFVKLLLALRPYFQKKGLNIRAGTYFKAAEGAISSIDRPSAVLIYRFLGYFLQSQGDIIGAAERYKKVLPLAKAIHDSESYGRALNNLGIAEEKLWNYESAEQIYNEALQQARKRRDWAGIFNALLNLGAAKANQLDFAAGLSFFSRAWQLALKRGNTDMIPTICQNIGVVEYRQNNITRARRWLLRGLRHAKEPDYIGQRSLILGNLAAVAIDEKNVNQARVCAEEALEIARSINQQERIGIVLTTLGEVHSILGDASKSAKCFEAAQEIGETFRLTELIAAVYSERGKALFRQEDLDTAEQLFQKLEKLTQGKNKEYSAEAKFGLAQIEFRRNNIFNAKNLAVDAHELLPKNHRLQSSITAFLISL